MKKFIKENWFKIIIAGILLIAVIGYLNYLNDRNAFNERQANEKSFLDSVAKKDATEKERKEYISNQKQNCLGIYKTEVAKWNNVESWYYNENDELCEISYRDPKPKSKAQCDTLYDTEGLTGAFLIEILNLHANCVDGLFTKTF